MVGSVVVRSLEHTHQILCICGGDSHTPKNLEFNEYAKAMQGINKRSILYCDAPPLLLTPNLTTINMSFTLYETKLILALKAI